MVTLTDADVGNIAFIKSKSFPYLIASKVMKKAGRIVTYDRKWNFEVAFVLTPDAAKPIIEDLKKVKADRKNATELIKDFYKREFDKF